MDTIVFKLILQLLMEVLFIVERTILKHRQGIFQKMKLIR